MTAVTLTYTWTLARCQEDPMLCPGDSWEASPQHWMMWVVVKECKSQYASTAVLYSLDKSQKVSMERCWMFTHLAKDCMKYSDWKFMWSNVIIDIVHFLRFHLPVLNVQNHSVNFIWNILLKLKIFSRTTGPISTKLCTKHPWMKELKFVQMKYHAYFQMEILLLWEILIISWIFIGYLWNICLSKVLM